MPPISALQREAVVDAALGDAVGHVVPDRADEFGLALVEFDHALVGRDAGQQAAEHGRVAAARDGAAGEIVAPFVEGPVAGGLEARRRRALGAPRAVGPQAIASEIAAAKTNARAIQYPFIMVPRTPLGCVGRRSNVPTIDFARGPPYSPRFHFAPDIPAMKVKSSLKSLKARHRACRVVRRKGRVYVINKVDPRYKAKQG